MLKRETSYADSKRTSLLICEIYMLYKIVQKQWSTLVLWQDLHL